jgi:transposase
MQGKKNYQEKLFTCFQLSDRIPQDNVYRRLKEVLDLQWIYKVTAKYYGTEGQQSVDPVVFFKLILIGYLENLSSDRRIINTVSLRLDVLYFIGYDIDECLPWHSTLSRTRQLYGQEVFLQLFREVLKQCIELGMVAGRRQTIDSVFVKANASMESLVEKEILEDATVYANSLDQQPQEAAPPSSGNNENYRQYSPSDPDARIATKRGKPSRLSYLAQVSVDSSSHVITNIEAHFADKRDSECLSEVVDHTRDNLQLNGLLVEEVIADANYSSGTVLQYLEDTHITGYIPNLGSYKKDREGFTYDPQKDEYTCSQGAPLTFRRMAPGRAGRYKKSYSSYKKDCLNCPIRSACIGNNVVKKLTVTQDKYLFDQMHTRMQTTKGKRMMQLRQSTVEPVLGTLVNFMGLRQINTKGIGQAGKCMIMAALAYNLKKLLKFLAPKVQAAIQEVRKMGLRRINMTFLTLYTSTSRHTIVRSDRRDRRMTLSN